MALSPLRNAVGGADLIVGLAGMKNIHPCVKKILAKPTSVHTIQVSTGQKDEKEKVDKKIESKRSLAYPTGRQS